MKPLYWKLLVLFGAIVVVASLVVPKTLRKSQNLDTPHSTNQVKTNGIAVNKDQTPQSIEFGFYEIAQADKLIMRMCLEDNICPRDKIGFPRKNKLGAILVHSRPIISNLDLSRAMASEHPQSRSPIVNIAMNVAGSKKFCKFTRQNRGQPFAIVLDGNIISTPHINAAICGGTGFIEGGFSMVEAKNIARALNAGTRPVKSRVDD